MTVKLEAPKKLFPVKGVRLAACASGIKKNQLTDLVLIELNENANCSAVFTQNRFRAAPVIIAEKNLAAMSPRLLMINSGNANAGTGDAGFDNAIATCGYAAAAIGCDRRQVLPFSTGVIGESLPTNCFEAALPGLVDELEVDAWLLAANGIMTTDTVAKGFSKQFDIDGTTVTLTGIAKGSGMIKPNMATMLSYIATDANIDKELLNDCLKSTVEFSFNSITVDGDTSTNDSCVLIATGESGAAMINTKDHRYDAFMLVLNEAMKYLAQAIIRDAEGITKFVEVKVLNAQTYQDAKTVGYTVAHSPLVKTALFASDPNWGRILAAVGRAEIDSLNIDKLSIFLDDVCIVSHGGRHDGYTEDAGQTVMSKSEIVITIDLAAGNESASIWTSDLSYDYVKINAEYRT